MALSFQIDHEHRLSEATWVPSEHFDERRPDDCLTSPASLLSSAMDEAQIQLVVIHCVSLPEGQYGHGAVERLFTGCLDVCEDPSFADLEGVRVSPHVLIGRTGGVTQFVQFDKRAWHAGVSAWAGRPGCNDYSIGIELEGCVHEAFTDAQYASLARVLRALIARYPALGYDRIVGHNEIAAGRKQDPGPFFSWRGLLTQLYPHDPGRVADNNF